MKIALVSRSVYPFHGYGGLERHVHDLARALIERDVNVTLVTRPPSDDREWDVSAIHPALRVEYVPYHTFPLAGRRGTTVIDRSTAYPIFGMRAGRSALALVRAGQADIVHGLGASVLGYAHVRSAVASPRASTQQAGGGATAPLVFNPQGLEEFGATDPSRARLKRVAYLPLRRAVLACAAAADAVIATDTALEPVVLQHLKIPPAKMRTIPNALDLHTIDTMTDPMAIRELRLKHGVDPSERVLLSV